MNILILGGNGYLGSKVASRMCTKHNVVCTKRTECNIERIKDFMEKITWIPSTADAIEAAMQYTSFDIIINMVSNYGRSDALYSNVLEANLEFPLRVLNKGCEHSVKKFITIGTGLPDEFNMYSFSKKQLAEFGRYYARKEKINFCNLKLEMFYGEDEPLDRFIPNTIVKMIKGEPVYTTFGTQRRDIICVEDVLTAIEIVVNTQLEGYHDIPVGTGIAPTIASVIDFIHVKTGCRSIVSKGAYPMRNNEPDCVADVSLLNSIGDFRPVFWQDGIENMINKITERIAH